MKVKTTPKIFHLNGCQEKVESFLNLIQAKTNKLIMRENR